MKILLISSQWSEKRKTGLGYTSSIHKKVLESIGFKVVTLGNDDDEVDYKFKNSGRINLLINYRKYSNFLKEIIVKEKPEIIFIESLQSILSEISIIVSNKLKKKIVLISHGISIFPYKFQFKYILRFIFWFPYIFFLFFILRKINIFLNFDNNPQNLRFFDFMIYKKILKKKEYYQIHNFSRFEEPDNLQIILDQPKNKIVLSTGYLNHIKNQIDILKIANEIKLEKVIFRIIYSEYDLNYLNKLKKYIKEKKITNVELVNSKFIDLNEEIKKSYVIINTSITEVMPLSIFEAMEKGKIYLSYDVGSVAKIPEIIVNKDIKHMTLNLKSLLENESIVLNSSLNLQKNYYKKYSILKLKEKLKVIFC